MVKYTYTHTLSGTGHQGSELCLRLGSTRTLSAAQMKISWHHQQTYWVQLDRKSRQWNLLTWVTWAHMYMYALRATTLNTEKLCQLQWELEHPTVFSFVFLYIIPSMMLFALCMLQAPTIFDTFLVYRYNNSTIVTTDIKPQRGTTIFPSVTLIWLYWPLKLKIQTHTVMFKAQSVKHGNQSSSRLLKMETRVALGSFLACTCTFEVLVQWEWAIIEEEFNHRWFNPRARTHKPYPH